MTLRRSTRRRLKIASGIATVALAAGAVVGAVVVTSHPSAPPAASAKVAQFYEENKDVPEPIDAFDAVFIGDSYTFGAGAATGQKWSSMVARYYGWGEHNFGYSATGYTTTADKEQCHLDYCPAYPEAVTKVASNIGPEYVIVSGGRNDSLGDPLAWEDAVNKTFTEIRARFPKSTILAVNPIAEDAKYIGAKPAVVKAAVEAVNGTFVDIGQPVMGKPELLSKDKVTPNFQGHLAIAQSFEKKCGPACKPTPKPKGLS